MRPKASIFCLAAVLLAACASTPERAPSVDLSAYDLSGLIVPVALPAPDDPLGFLRPDAGSDRDDVEIITRAYTISGSTAGDLLNGEDGIRPKAKEAGLDFFARVDWRVSWQYEYDVEDDLCRADNVSTRLTVTYQLPDWDPDTDAPAGLVDYWTDFERDLWAHEYGHALIGYRVQQDIQRVLSDADISDPECDVVGQSLNRLGQAITARGLDAEYDELTGHGRTQGAVFNLNDARVAARQRDGLPEG